MKTTLSVATLAVLLSLLLLGCGSPQGSAPRASAPQGAATAKKGSEPARGPEARKTLTEDQRIRWEKTRTLANGEGGRWTGKVVNVVGYFTDRKEWLAAGFQDWRRGLPVLDPVEAPSPWAEEPGDAAKRAARAAANQKIKIVAVVDLYSKADPFVVSWYYDDGKGAKEFKACPRADLEGSLHTYLYDLQTFAESVRR